MLWGWEQGTITQNCYNIFSEMLSLQQNMSHAQKLESIIHWVKMYATDTTCENNQMLYVTKTLK